MTTILIAITVIFSFWAWNKPTVLSKSIHNPYISHQRKEYYRLLSSGFIHGDYMHLFFNMYSLYLFGGVVESYFSEIFGASGQYYFLALYLLGIIVANIPDFVTKKNNPGFNSLGASGGVSSIVFASVILSPLSKMGIFPIPFMIPAYLFAVIYVAYSIYMDKRQGDNINHMAHLWGGIWGVLFIALSIPASIPYFFEQIKNSF
jgi:membrane associated rhomboid family serine protease